MNPANPARILSPSELSSLVDGLIAGGVRVIAPAAAGADPDRTEYRAIAGLGEAALGGPLPHRSLKEFFLPPTEVLLRYRQRKDGVDLEEVATTFPPQLILGARPCDAAGVETLDEVMGWDYRDELWFGRRDATTIVSLACQCVDSTCFCGALGAGPDSTKGADAQLIPLDPALAQPTSALAAVLRRAVDAFLVDTEPFQGAAEAAAPRPRATARGWLARALTPKGEALLEGRGVPLSDPADLKVALEFVKGARARMRRNLTALGLDADGDRVDVDVDAQLAAADGGQLMVPARTCQPVDQTRLGRLPEWLAANFDHPLWKTLALRCHGCGACASVCPTCHCFDIVDEPEGVGARRAPAQLGHLPDRRSSRCTPRATTRAPTRRRASGSG